MGPVIYSSLSVVFAVCCGYKIAIAIVKIRFEIEAYAVSDPAEPN